MSPSSPTLDSWVNGGRERIDNPHYIASIVPNPKVVIDSLPTNEAMKKSYEILVKAVNDEDPSNFK